MLICSKTTIFLLSPSSGAARALMPGVKLAQTGKIQVTIDMSSVTGESRQNFGTTFSVMRNFGAWRWWKFWCITTQSYLDWIHSTSDYLHNSTETKRIWSQADEFRRLADLDRMVNFTPSTKLWLHHWMGIKNSVYGTNRHVGICAQILKMLEIGTNKSKKWRKSFKNFGAKSFAPNVGALESMRRPA